MVALEDAEPGDAAGCAHDRQGVAEATRRNDRRFGSRERKNGIARLRRRMHEAVPLPQ
jgi:hypothetical protein